jgi:AcrR family transcriptional regulator
LIDATERAVSRNGIRRTTMSDLAREMNVARSTLYRQVDSVDQAIVLAGARATHRFWDEVAHAAQSGTEWSRLFIDAVVHLLKLRDDNQLLSRLVEHEPELLGEALSQDALAPVMAGFGKAAASVFETAMAAGHLRRVDPLLLAESLSRVVLALVLCRPTGDPREMVEFLMKPVLMSASS